MNNAPREHSQNGPFDLSNIATDSVSCSLLSNLYRLLAENTVDCIWLFDFTHRSLLYISPSLHNLLGYTSEELLQLPQSDYMPPDERVKLSNKIKKCLADFETRTIKTEVISSSIDSKLIHRNNEIIDVEHSIKFITNGQSEHVCLIGITRDISDRKRIEEKLTAEIEEKNQMIEMLKQKELELKQLTEILLEKNESLKALAGTDELTNLFNRYYLDQRIVSEMERAERYDQPLSLIMFDLDHFKKVNDTWGHSTGDLVLIAVADRVSQIIRYPDVLARWGGEEFAILLPQTDLHGAILVAEKIRRSLEDIEHPGVGVVTSSFGVATLKKNEQWESWFKRVDLALYQAKDEGRNKVISNDDITKTPLSYVKVKWNTQWACGNDLIDEQHEELLNLCNQLLEHFLSKSSQQEIHDSLEQFTAHVLNHFEDEEKLHSEMNYPDAQNHSLTHDVLVEKVMAFKQAFMDDKVNPSSFFTFVMDEVILGHLLTEDVLYFPYVKTTSN